MTVEGEAEARILPFPSVTFSDVSVSGGPIELTVYGADTVSLLKSSHNLKFGAEGSRYQFNTRGADGMRGTVYFRRLAKWTDPANVYQCAFKCAGRFHARATYQAAITVGQFGRGYREWAYAFFVQDSWRATRRLTLDYGLRYEYSAPWTEVNNKLSNFVPGIGLMTPQSPGWEGLYRPDPLKYFWTAVWIRL